MPAGTLLTSTPVVRLAEDVEDKIYNFRPTDAPLISSISRVNVEGVNHEWTADTYRAPTAGNKAAEGADATFSTAAQPQTYGNRTQIIQDTVSVSGTAEAVKKYGRKSEVDRLKAKKMIELKRDQEASSIANGTAIIASGATAGQMRGLYGFIATNRLFGAGGAAPDPVANTAPTVGTLRPFTQTLLDDTIRNVYTNGGDADVLMVTPLHKQRVSTFTGNVQRTNEVNAQKSNEVKLQTSFSIFGHDFGVTKVVPNRVMAIAGAGTTNTAYVIDYDKIKTGKLRGWQSSELAKVGDSEQWQVLTEVTLVVPQESTLGAIADLTATGA